MRSIPSPSQSFPHCNRMGAADAARSRGGVNAAAVLEILQLDFLRAERARAGDRRNADDRPDRLNCTGLLHFAVLLLIFSRVATAVLGVFMLGHEIVGFVSALRARGTLSLPHGPSCRRRLSKFATKLAEAGAVYQTVKRGRPSMPEAGRISDCKNPTDVRMKSPEIVRNW